MPYPRFHYYNELLLQLLNAKQINIEQMLQVGAFPFADRLLQLIQAQKQEIQNQQQALAQQGAVPVCQDCEQRADHGESLVSFQG